MKKTIFLFVLITIVIFILFMLGGSFFTDKLIDEQFTKLTAGVNTESADTYNRSEIKKLPFFVQNYFKFAIKDGAGKPEFVRVRQRADFKTDQGGDWKELEAKQYYRIDEPGFLWDATINVAGPYWLRAIDSYIDGRGNMLLKVLSSVTISDTESDEIDQSNLVRYLTEALLFPTALLPKEDMVEWRKIDNSSARVYLQDGDLRVSAVFYFDHTGKVIKVQTMDKYRTTNYGYTKAVYTLVPDNYEQIGSFTVPTTFEVSWSTPDSVFKYGEFEIVEIEYDVPEQF